MDLKEKNLYSEEEANELLLKVIEHPTIQEYNELDNLLQKRYTIRWTIDELFSGVKLLPLDVEITLEESVSQKGVVKIGICLHMKILQEEFII